VLSSQVDILSIRNDEIWDHGVIYITTTGASGVLGTQVYEAFAQAGHDVVGLAHSRATGTLKQVDLMDEARTNEVFGDPEFKPDCECADISLGGRLILRHRKGLCTVQQREGLMLPRR
jgi:hypothetical protein